jgi:hypothetical protein
MLKPHRVLPSYPSNWRRPRRLRHLLAWAGSSALLGLVGCATSSGAPTEQMAVSSAAVAAAVSAGSPEWAAPQMRAARDKLDQAQAALAAKDHSRALMLAHEAQADAQLATATARANKAQKSANDLQESNRVLREEIARKTMPPSSAPAAATPATPTPILRN